MQVVLLAAGTGTRLRPFTDNLPKCLVDVGGRPLLDRALSSIEGAGITDVVLGTGYRDDRIADFLRARGGAVTVTCVKNERFDTTNNAYSLHCVRSAVRGPFILMDGDLLFESAVLTRLLEAEGDAVLAVEKRKELGHEEMKVILAADGSIAQVSKEVDPKASVGEAVGMARFSADLGGELFAQLGRQVDEGRTNVFYEKAFEELIAAGRKFRVGDVSGLRCMEIDTPEDLERAKEMSKWINP